MNTPSRRPRGLALLEFALGVAIAALVAALALAAMSRLQWLGDEARRVTLATNQAAASSTQLLRCGLHGTRRAAVPEPAAASTAASTPSSCP